jgi:hypothetical protein
VKETAGIPAAQEMIRLLADGHETVARTARPVFAVAEKDHDQPTFSRSGCRSTRRRGECSAASWRK